MLPGSSIHDVLGQTVTTEDGPPVIIGIAEDFRIGQTPAELQCSSSH
jgi:hypothetical protein